MSFRRQLTRDDMERCQFPVRHWRSGIEGIQETILPHVRRYLDSLEDFRERGVGLLLWGINGVGKTGAAVSIAKEYRRRGYSVLFVEAASLKTLVMEHTMFDDDVSLIERARRVDVLVLDDLGKGVSDNTGFGVKLLDELLRHRNANVKVTIVTTNMNLKALGDELKPSTMHTLKECIVPIHCDGADLREEARAENTKMVTG